MEHLITIPKEKDKIQLRKKLNGIVSRARKNAKQSSCILCGKQQTSFCNSHSVPQLSLKAIASKGKLLQSSFLFGAQVIDIEKGINNSGTFNCICKECDSKFFAEYENYDNLLRKPTDKMLAEIAVKNVLLQLSKRYVERELYKIQQEKFGSFINLDVMKNIQNTDINEYIEETKLHQAIVEQGKEGAYQVLFWEILPYTVPIAMQSAIALRKDLEGIEVNNIYDEDPSVRMQYLHLCVLPLEMKSVVLAFYHKRDKNYRRLRHQFNSISASKKLEYINYLIFSYCENYFISETIKPELEKCDNLLKLSREVNGFPNMGFLSVENRFGIGYTPVNCDEIPNFLAPEWAVPKGTDVDNNKA